MSKKGIFSLILLSLLFVGSASAEAYVSVKGYYRSNGTYVQPYVRSNPNGLKYDNYGYTPNQGLYNPTYGTRGAEWDTPTYITDPDYYVGKSLYEQKKTSYTSPFLATTLPAKNISYVTKLWVGNNPNVPCEQSTFLRAKEKIECGIYKSSMNKYMWNVTTTEFNGKDYVYDPKTEIISSCLDGYYFGYDSSTGKPVCYPVQNSIQSLPVGCITTAGYSPISGLSCSSNTCASGSVLKDNACKPIQT